MLKNYKKMYFEELAKNKKLIDSNMELNDKLIKAERLDTILTKIWGTTQSHTSTFSSFHGNLGIVDNEFNIINVNSINGGEPAIYVDDMLGGKVIKQEATKCIVINPNGTVQEGYTKQPPDKQYKYKVVRSDFNGND